MGKPKTSIISKTSDRRAKQREIWGSGVSIQCTEGTFDTSVIKVILGSFGAFRFLTSLISKMAGRRAKRIEICASGLSIHRVLLTLKWLRSFWGHSGVVPIFKKPCVSKTAGLE